MIMMMMMIDDEDTGAHEDNNEMTVMVICDEVMPVTFEAGSLVSPLLHTDLISRFTKNPENHKKKE